MKHHRFCVAPMMAISDRHFRYMWRIISSSAMLYTEMITAAALVYGDPAYLLRFNDQEQPLALQLGGSDPDLLSKACEIASAYRFSEINLNVGCPSPRVSSGAFGACMLKAPDVLTACFQAMQQATDLPVTIKTRLGVDDFYDYESLLKLIARLSNAGCQTFILHARRAWLKGLSPKENRDVPPLCYDWVYRIKQAMPELTIVINGGILDLDMTGEHLRHVDGVMVGRAAYEYPMRFAELDQKVFGIHTPGGPVTPERVVQAYWPYLNQKLSEGDPWHALIKPLIALYHGLPGARAWRRLLTAQSLKQSSIKERLCAIELHINNSSGLPKD